MQDLPCHAPVPKVCSLCGRRFGKPAAGAAINSIGCTGACLDWAARVIKNPPCFHVDRAWIQEWPYCKTVTPEDVATFRAICSDMNEFGYAYLHWNLGRSDLGPGNMLAAGWIALACQRYACFLNRLHENVVATRCPQVQAFYQMLDILHQSCLQVSTVVDIVHCEVVNLWDRHTRMRALHGTKGR